MSLHGSECCVWVELIEIKMKMKKSINLIHRFVNFCDMKSCHVERENSFKNSSAYPKSSFMFTCLPLTLNWAEKSIRDVCDSSWLTHEWKTHKSLATTTAENKKSFLLHDGSERMEKILMMMKWICSNMLQCVLKCEEKKFTNWRDCRRCKGW